MNRYQDDEHGCRHDRPWDVACVLCGREVGPARDVNGRTLQEQIDAGNAWTGDGR